MRNNLVTLIKNNFLLYKGSFEKAGQGKKNRNALLLIAIVFVFLGISTGSSVASIIAELTADGKDIIYALYYTVDVALLYSILIVVLKGTAVKKTNDYELLASLPIKKITIIASKLVSDIIFDLLFVILGFLPGVIVFITQAPDAANYIIINAIIIIILLGLLINGLSNILRILVNTITRRMRNKDIIRTIINVLIIIFFLIYYYASTLSQTELDIKYGSLGQYNPINILFNYLYNNELMSFLIIFGICIFAFLLSTIIFTLTFDRFDNVQNYKSKIYYQKKSIKSTLIKNEITRYLKSTLYVTNTIIGCFLAVIFGIVLIWFKGVDKINDFLVYKEIPLGNQTVFLVFVAVLGLMISSVCLTASSISIEGKSFWILKSNPVDFKDIVKAKVMSNFLVGTFFLIAASILTGIAFKADFIGILYVLILPQLSLLFTCYYGLYNNLKYPNIHFVDEQEVFKRGISIIKSMFVGPLHALFIALLNMVLSFIVSPYIIMIVSIIIISVLIVIIRHNVYTKGYTNFQKIE